MIRARRSVMSLVLAVTAVIVAVGPAVAAIAQTAAPIPTVTAAEPARASAQLAAITGLAATWSQVSKDVTVTWNPYADASATREIAVNLRTVQKTGPMTDSYVVSSTATQLLTKIRGGAVYTIFVEAYDVNDQSAISSSTATTLVCPATTLIRASVPRTARLRAKVKISGYVFAGPDTPKPPGGNWAARGNRTIRVTPYFRARAASKWRARTAVYANLPGAADPAQRSPFTAYYRPTSRGSYRFRVEFRGTAAHKPSHAHATLANGKLGICAVR